MAIAVVQEAILQGEAYQTFSATVETEDVLRGMALEISDNKKVRPAQAGARVVGVALYDAVIGDKVTYAVVPEGAFIARMLLTESQTVEAGDPLKAGSITIAGVTTNGLLAKQTDATLTAITQTFTDAAIATHDDAKINSAINGLIDELDAFVVKVANIVTQIGGVLTQAKSFVGIALEDVTTTADEAKVIKVLVKGPSL